MPEGTGPLRDLHPQILRRGARAGEFQFAAGAARGLRAKDTKVGCACLKVITIAGFSGATMDRSGLRQLLVTARAQRLCSVWLQ